MLRNKKRGQEEMVGFALIIIIVAVILLIFLSLSLRKPKSENVENYEVNSFIQSFLQYTTDCAKGYEPAYYNLEGLIISCYREEECLDERSSCEVLNSTLKGIMEEAWKVEGDRPVKGYKIKINSEEETILEFNKGNVTNNYKSSFQDLGKEKVQISIEVYY